MSMIAIGSSDSGGLPKKVLVCDDERHIVRLIQVNLERLGHEVTVAFDGREAIEKLEVGEFTHAIVDLMMPYLDGMEVLQWIRTHPHTEHLWVGIMTYKAEGLAAEPELAYRPDEFIKKPFNPMAIPW